MKLWVLFLILLAPLGLQCQDVAIMPLLEWKGYKASNSLPVYSNDYYVLPEYKADSKPVNITAGALLSFTTKNGFRIEAGYIQETVRMGWMVGFESYDSLSHLYMGNHVGNFYVNRAHKFPVTVTLWRSKRMDYQSVLHFSSSLDGGLTFYHAKESPVSTVNFGTSMLSTEKSISISSGAAMYGRNYLLLHLQYSVQVNRKGKELFQFSIFGECGFREVMYQQVHILVHEGSESRYSFVTYETKPTGFGVRLAKRIRINKLLRLI